MNGASRDAIEQLATGWPSYGCSMSVEKLPPPTIASLAASGITGARISCANNRCMHSGVVPFDVMAVPPETGFPDIIRKRRFRCTACGGRDVCAMPDWTSYQPPGKARHFA